MLPEYFSSKQVQVAYVKPRGLSFDDLAASPESD